MNDSENPDTPDTPETPDTPTPTEPTPAPAPAPADAATPPAPAESPTAATSAAPSLVEELRDRIANATTPLTTKELAKGLKKPRNVKAPEFEASLPGYLADDLRSGLVFQYPSGKSGALRFWHRDEKHAIREAVLNAATPPKKLAELKKTAKEETKADKAFADSVVDELVTEEQLHKHGSAATAPYGREKPHDPNDPEMVRKALLDAAETPAKLNDLIKKAQAETKADKKFVTDMANKLVEEKQLHKQSDAKTAPYGLIEPKPPHPLETGKGKKDFDKLVKTARALVESSPLVSAPEVIDRLRAALANEPAPAPAKPRDDFQITDKVHDVVSKTSAPHKPEHLPKDVSPVDIRKGLKEAYDELCLDPDFQDRVVELRRLYHEAHRHMPQLTVKQFHHELEELQAQRAVELQALNEVQHAQEPELAIQKDDRLLYYARWR